MITSFSDFAGQRPNDHHYGDKERDDDPKYDEGHVIKKIELHFVWINLG